MQQIKTVLMFLISLFYSFRKSIILLYASFPRPLNKGEILWCSNYIKTYQQKRAFKPNEKKLFHFNNVMINLYIPLAFTIFFWQ